MGKGSWSRAGGFLDRVWGLLWPNRVVLGIIIGVYLVLILVSFLLAKPKKPLPPMDVVFVFDTTGSMSDEIAGMIRVATDFAFVLKSNNVECRIGVVTFGAVEEPQVIRGVQDLTHDVDQIKQFLRAQNALGGGDEDQIKALHYAFTDLKNYRSGVEKTFILITDEKHTRRSKASMSFDQIVGLLADENAHTTVYVVADPAQDGADYKRLARMTGGKFYDIHGSVPFTDIIAQIAKDIVQSIMR